MSQEILNKEIADWTIKNNFALYLWQDGISIAVLAERIQVSRQTLTEIEKGKRLPSLITAYKIAYYFNKKVEDV